MESLGDLDGLGVGRRAASRKLDGLNNVAAISQSLDWLTTWPPIETSRSKDPAKSRVADMEFLPKLSHFGPARSFCDQFFHRHPQGCVALETYTRETCIVVV